jgi:hypothetical protein
VSRRPAWLWPYRPGLGVAAAVDRVVARCGPAAGRWWVPVAVVVGAVPVLVASVTGGGWHGAATGLLSLPAVLACVRADRTARAIGVLGIAVAAHSVAVVALTVRDPIGTAGIVPGAEDYWQKTRHWIVTGDDVAEYRPADWLPDHLVMVAGVPFAGYTSLGAIPLAAGVTQIDLMNYYVGRLVLAGDSPTVMVLLGWHPWSVLRGLGYAVLIVEAVSLSLERLVGRPLSTRRRRVYRWAGGVSLVCADAAVKFWFAEAIRTGLQSHLIGG